MPNATEFLVRKKRKGLSMLGRLFSRRSTIVLERRQEVPTFHH
ncbi:hypothetical protein Godav_029814 [Gossypium davidsonii]|uniref:Uncharacterized protein n=1 Tax=Gossypium davidsonii TaxID=34287 RepID=A0A7J8TIQ3_GOSDV|nr:hypothetical protein [Gossypium davidsonii]